MTLQMRPSLIIIAMTVIIVGAHRNKRDVFPSSTNIAIYSKPHSRSFFLNQRLSDRIIDQPASLDQTLVGLQAPHETSLRERSVYPPNLSIFHQPFKSNSFHTAAAFKDEPLYRDDAVLRSPELRGERMTFSKSPFEVQSPSLTSGGIFEMQAPTYKSQAPFKKQLFPAEAQLKNLFHGQSPLEARALFQKQATPLDELPLAAGFVRSYQDDFYSKPIDSYGRQKNAQALSYGGSPVYVENGNSKLELPSLPLLSPPKNMFPLGVPVLTGIHESASPQSSVSSGISYIHSPEAFKVKLGPTLASAVSTTAGKCGMLVDGSLSTLSSGAVTTAPSISAGANQSSIVGHILTSLTIKPDSPVMTTATPVIPFVEKPIYFHATKYGAVTTPSFIPENELKNHIHTFSLPVTSKSNLKIDEHNFKYLMPEVSKNDMKTDTESRTLNYFLHGEQRSPLKDDTQNSFATNNALPAVLKHGWSPQQFSQPETPSGHAPLYPSGKLILPSTSAASASAISWPIEADNDVPVILPAKSVMAFEETTSNDVPPLEVNLPLDFTTSIPNSLTPTVADSISGSITGSISTSIPGGMTADMPASIPTLNLGQSLHRAEQLRQTQEARNPWYLTGLQLQLGGFGGINYTLRTSDPTARPMELGLAKAGLTPPKLPQPHAPAFARVSS